jgi:phenylpropionate dioxygenase-like ring-hydroxylating dioxygenase large terminal subunit
MGYGFRPEEVAPCLTSLETARWLPSRAYYDPEIAKAEFDRISRPGWHCVALTERFNEPGDYVTARLLGERVLVVMDHDRKIRVLRNVCLHRGMWLARGEGRATAFKCPYHCWTYDLSGRLTGAPGMEKTHGFQLRNLKLQEVRSEVWQCFVMATVNESAEPYGASLQAQELNEILEPWGLANLKVVLEQKYDVSSWNWKIMGENGMEGYHVMGTHLDSAESMIPVSRLELRRTREQALASGWTDLWHGYSDEWRRKLAEPAKAPHNPPAIPGLPQWAFEANVFLSTFTGPPSLSLSPEGVMSYMYERTDEGTTNLVWRLHAPSSLKEWNGFDEFIQWKSSLNDRIQAEDEEACRGAMEGISSGHWKPTQYSYLEKSVYHFHQWYLMKMGFLAENLQETSANEK